MLLSGLPGEKAQNLMAPVFRDPFIHDRDPVRAAVLILLYPSDEGNPMLVFIKRNEYNGPHSGQVSLPGGAREKGDHSLMQTAVRETREELGIKNDLEILGSLTDLHIRVSNYLVRPYVGCMDQRPAFQPDSSEVQFIIESSLSHMLDPRNRDSEMVYRHGRSIETPFYRVDGEKIWGATAMIMSEFLQLASMLQ